MLASFAENPPECKFNGQNSDERIILFLRAHPIANLPWVLMALIIASLPFVVPFLIDLLNISLPEMSPLLPKALIIIDVLAVSFIVIEGFLHWYFNVNIVTNNRIVDIDFEHLLSNNIDHAPLTSVEEASARVSGVLGLIFHFGNVSIQTAGAAVSLDFVKVPDPSKVADVIHDEADRAKKEQQGGNINGGG